MSDFRKHAMIGAAVGTGVGILVFCEARRRNPEAKLSLGNMLLHTGIGLVASCLPDFLEPATSPNHRDFFHSISFALAGCWLYQRARDETPDEELKSVLMSLCIGYGSHLVADIATTKGLPIV